MRGRTLHMRSDISDHLRGLQAFPLLAVMTPPCAGTRALRNISTFTTLVPGDIIITGTPTGAGARFEPPKFLKPGDEIEVEVEGIGKLINKVVDE